MKKGKAKKPHNGQRQEEEVLGKEELKGRVVRGRGANEWNSSQGQKEGEKKPPREH